MVSVIIPNYNHAPYLTQRIESVLNQTFQDFQLIILDDCSTDNSKEIIEKYRTHPKVSDIVFNRENSGSTFRQWKRGVDLAQGDWVWIAESDDYCDLNFLETLIVADLDDCGLHYCLSVPVDTEGVNIKEIVYPTVEGSRHKGNNFLERYLLESNYILNASSVLIRKDILEKALSPTISTYKLLGDWLVWFNACLLTDVIFFDTVRNYHRCHRGTVRTRLTQEGRYYDEFPRFRKEINRMLLLSKFGDKSTLISKNNRIFSDELGRKGCELIQKRQLVKAIPLILKATLKSNFNLYYLRSAVYWLLKKRKPIV